MLGVSIFPFVSFSSGILSHLLLRDHNDQYLKETKDVAKGEGEECSWLHYRSSRAFSWELQRYDQILAGGSGLG